MLKVQSVKQLYILESHDMYECSETRMHSCRCLIHFEGGGGGVGRHLPSPVIQSLLHLAIATVMRLYELRGGYRISGRGGLKMIFTMGEGTGGRAPPIGVWSAFFTFSFIYM